MKKPQGQKHLGAGKFSKPKLNLLSTLALEIELGH